MINKEDWNASQVIANNGNIRTQITEIIINYFLFKNINLSSENSTVIVQSIYDYCRNKPRFKLYDLQYSIEKYKLNDDNNLSAAHILGMFERYIQSEERKIFIRNLENDAPKIEAAKYSEENILKIAETNLSLIRIQYEKTGIVSLSMSPAQFEMLTKAGYFEFIKHSKDELNKIAINEHIAELENSIYKLNLKDAMEVKNRISEIGFGKLTDEEVKILRRKYILKQYFKQLKNNKQ